MPDSYPWRASSREGSAAPALTAGGRSLSLRWVAAWRRASNAVSSACSSSRSSSLMPAPPSFASACRRRSSRSRSLGCKSAAPSAPSSPSPPPPPPPRPLERLFFFFFFFFPLAERLEWLDRSELASESGAASTLLPLDFLRCLRARVRRKSFSAAAATAACAAACASARASAASLSATTSAAASASRRSCSSLAFAAAARAASLRS